MTLGKNIELILREYEESDDHFCKIGMLNRFETSDLVTEYDLLNHVSLDNCAYTMRDYLDGRKSTDLVRFKYCPECGAKIHWGIMRGAWAK